MYNVVINSPTKVTVQTCTCTCTFTYCNCTCSVHVHLLAPSLAAVMSNRNGLKNRRADMGRVWRSVRQASNFSELNRYTLMPVLITAKHR